MKLTKKIIISFALVAAGFVSAGLADPTTDDPTHYEPKYNRFENPYLSVNVGPAYAGPMNYKTLRYSGQGLRGEGANLFLGDQFYPYFAAEIGFSALDYPTMGSLLLLSLNGRLTFPIGERFSIYGKLGPGLAELTTCRNSKCTTSSSTVPAFGGGLGYGFASRWMAALEYNGTYLPESVDNGQGNFGALTLGVTYYFVW